VSRADQIDNRAERLEILLGGRAPWLVPWLPLVGVALGLALGALVWLVAGSRIILFREAAVALGAAFGLAVGLFERTRVGRAMLAEPRPDVHDLPAEFDHVPRRFDHREDALDRRERF
jgi:hypothetical protein